MRKIVLCEDGLKMLEGVRMLLNEGLQLPLISLGEVFEVLKFALQNLQKALDSIVVVPHQFLKLILLSLVDVLLHQLNELDVVEVLLEDVSELEEVLLSLEDLPQQLDDGLYVLDALLVGLGEELLIILSQIGSLVQFVHHVALNLFGIPIEILLVSRVEENELGDGVHSVGQEANPMVAGSDEKDDHVVSLRLAFVEDVDLFLNVNEFFLGVQKLPSRIFEGEELDPEIIVLLKAAVELLVLLDDRLQMDSLQVPVDPAIVSAPHVSTQLLFIGKAD